MQGQILGLSLHLLTRKGVDTPPAAKNTQAPGTHLAVQEAVEDRDEEALEGDKQQSHHGAVARGAPGLRSFGATLGFGDVWFWEGAEIE